MTDQQVIRYHAKSFYWASIFLPKKRQGPIYSLYAVCRKIDDTADELALNEAQEGLKNIRAQLAGTQPADEDIHRFLRMAVKEGVSLQVLNELIDGAEYDLNPVRVADDKEFLHYCYLVAGTVGLMMSPLLGVNSERAWKHAKDLGIAMQITNICRDVIEDANNQRVYLPESRLHQVRLRSQDILNQDFNPSQLAPIVKDLLKMADQYYESGRKGLGYIPWRARIAILVASHIYQAIGKKIAENQHNVFMGRAFVPKLEKLWITFKSLCQMFRPKYWSLSVKSVNQLDRGVS